MLKSLLIVSVLVATANSAPPAPYFAVLAGQQPSWASPDDLWNEVSNALGHYIDAHGVKLPLGANGKIETVHQIFLRGSLATRHGARGATEVIGTADFMGDTIAHRYVGDHEERSFRLTLDAHGALVSFAFQNVDNSQLVVERPTFAPVTKLQARQIADRLVAFYKASNATGDNLSSALAGNSSTFEATIGEVTATTTDFGDFGQIARVTTQLQPKPGMDGSRFTYVLEVASDKAGNVVSTGAAW